MPRQLKNMEINKVAIVDIAANKRKFFLMKGKENKMNMDELVKKHEDEIAKLNTEHLAKCESLKADYDKKLSDAKKESEEAIKKAKEENKPIVKSANEEMVAIGKRLVELKKAEVNEELIKSAEDLSNSISDFLDKCYGEYGYGDDKEDGEGEEVDEEEIEKNSDEATKALENIEKSILTKEDVTNIIVETIEKNK